MNCTHDSQAMIRHWEGYRGTAYNKDGHWTIGFGHTIGVQEGDTCTLDVAIAWFAHDISLVEMCVTSLVQVPLSQDEFDALCSFTYNEGPGRLAKSTLLHKLNDRQYTAAASEFAKWVWGVDPTDPARKRRKIMDGLVRRRTWEHLLFTKGSA